MKSRQHQMQKAKGDNMFLLLTNRKRYGTGAKEEAVCRLPEGSRSAPEPMVAEDASPIMVPAQAHENPYTQNLFGEH